MPVYRIDKDVNKRLHDYRVVINYTDEFGRYKKKEKILKNALLKDANKLEAKMKMDIEQNGSPSKFISFKELTDKYYEYKLLDVRKNTLDSDFREIRNHLLPFFGTIDINKITVPLIEKFKLELNSKISERTNKPLSLVFKKSLFTTLTAILNYGVKFHNLKSNPCIICGNFKLKNYTIEKEKLHYLTLDQFNLFTSIMENNCTTIHDWDFYVFFNIIFFCGLRKSEAYALRWTRYDNGKLLVRKSITQKNKGEAYTEDQCKNKSSVRDVPVCERLRIILEEHKERCKDLNGFNEQFFICGGIEPIRDSTLTNVNNKYLKMANLPHIRIHDYRHSFASLLINQDVNIKVISKLMGHSTVEQTWNRYSHMYPEAENEAIDKLNKINKIN